MTDDRSRSAARGQDDQARAARLPGERTGQHPFLQKIRQVERQGVPEEGVVNPGPPPRPVRSGEFHAGPNLAESQGEEGQ